jgi:hypothetical protein
MPFVSALLGIALGDTLDRTRGGWRAIGVALVVVFLGAHVWAVRAKLTLMRDCGDRAIALLSGLEPHLPDIPTGGVLLLVNPEGEERLEYSVFTMWGFNPLRTGTVRLNQLARRTDFRTLIVQSDEVEQERASARGQGRAVLTIQVARDSTQLTRLESGP